MPCTLTGSQPLDCKDSVGGIRELKVKVHPGATTIANDFTIDSSGVVTAIASGSRNTWYTYELEKETTSVNVTGQYNPQNGTTWYQQEIKLIMNKLSARLFYEFDQMAKARILVAIRDFNDVYMLFGLDFGCDVTAATMGSGTGRGDRSGYEVTLMGKEKRLTPTITAAIWNTLIS